MSKELRIIAAKSYDVRDVDCKRVGKRTYYVGMWNCPFAAHHEVKETAGCGNLFRGIPGPKCVMVDDNGVYLDEWRCEHFEGIMEFRMDPRETLDAPMTEFIKCSCDLKVTVDELNHYNNGIDKIRK